MKLPMVHIYIVRLSKWHWNVFFKNSVWSIGWPR